MIRNFFIVTAIISIFAVSCNGDDDSVQLMGVTPSYISFEHTGDSASVYIYGGRNELWEMIIGDGVSSWCSFDKSGTQFTSTGYTIPEEDVEVWMYSEPNPLREIKYDTIRIYDRTYGETRTVYIELEAIPITMTTADTLNYVSSEAKVYSYDMEYNLDTFKGVENENNWFSVTVDTNTKKINVDVTENTTPYIRKGTFTLSGEWSVPADTTTLEIEIIQDGADGGLSNDIVALKELNTQYNLGWDTSLPIEEWDDVEVSYVITSEGSELRVIGLNLSNSDITTFPDLSKFSYLSNLRLNGNNISGDIPPGLYRLIYLNLLWLSDNPNLTGTISDEIANLSLLNNLSIANTKISGNIPEAIGTLPLNYLVLNDNYLTGELPVSLGDNESLLVLIVNGNNLTGSVPSNYQNNFQWYYWTAEENILPQRDGVLAL